MLFSITGKMRQIGLIEAPLVVYRNLNLLRFPDEDLFLDGDVMLKPDVQNQGRFSALLSKTRRGTELWDEVLYESRDFLVAPTKGSIVPFWVLLIPKSPVLNFAQLRQNDLCRPFEMVATVASHFNSSSSIWFEHGASTFGSATGCGVDHAHIHILLQPKFSLSDFCSEAVGASDVAWIKASSHEAYDQIEPDEDYYVCGDHTSAFVARGKSLGRQFFRKVIAKLENLPDEWDYEQYHHLPNVLNTIGALEARQLNAA
jgi:ATP adenylyltransferase